jgi:hypothetical protein
VKASLGAAAGWAIGTGSVEEGAAVEGAGGEEDDEGAVVATFAGGARSSDSPGFPSRYPAMPEPSIKTTTNAAKVDRFMGNLPP